MPPIVLVHSYPTNSIILKGLIDAIEEHVQVHPIDLPGFHAKVPPLTEFTMAKFNQAFTNSLRLLGLRKYVIAAVSFGFAVTNFTHPPPECQGIIAITPYLNTQSLKIDSWIKELGQRFCEVTTNINLDQFIAEGVLDIVTKKWTAAQNLIPAFKKHIDPTTFISTLDLLLEYKQEPIFYDLPYVLLMNQKDEILKTKYVLKQFREKAKYYKYIPEPLPHVPPRLDKAYFVEQKLSYYVNGALSFIAKTHRNT